MGATDPPLATPADVLAALEADVVRRKGAQFPDPTQEQLESIIHRVGLSPEEEKAVLEEGTEMFKGWARQLVEDIAPSLRHDLRDRLLDEDAVLVADLNTAESNAFAIRTPNEGWLIVLNRGLAAFIYKVARALGTHFRTEDPNDDPEAAPGCASEQIPIVFDWYVTTGVPLGPDFDVSALQIRVANSLAIAAERFVLAHEIGHHVLDHVGHKRQVKIGDHELSAMSLREEQEHEADVFGARLTLEAAQRDGDGFSIAIAWAGTELALRAIDMLETYSPRPRPRRETHPPAAERLRVVRDAYEADSAPDEFAFVTHLADAIAELLSLEHEEMLRRKAEVDSATSRREFAEFLQGLIEDCSAGPVPNYFDFRARFAARRFEHHPEAICHGLAAALDRSFLTCDESPEGAAVPEWTHLKLLLGLVRDDQTLCVPVRKRSGEFGVVTMLGQPDEGDLASSPGPELSLEWMGR